MTTYDALALVCGALLLIAVAGMLLLLAGLCQTAARQHAALNAAEEAARKERDDSNVP